MDTTLVLSHDILVTIFETLKNPKDQSNLGMTCKRMYRIYEECIKYKKFVDPRPFITNLNEIGHRRTFLRKAIEKVPNDRCHRISNIAFFGFACISITSVNTLFFSYCCCYACLSTTAKNALVYTTFSATLGSVGSYLISSYREDRYNEEMSQHEVLLMEYLQVDQELKEDWEELPKKLEMKEEEIPLVTYNRIKMNE